MLRGFLILQLKILSSQSFIFVILYDFLLISMLILTCLLGKSYQSENTVMAKNIDTLGKYDQRRLWKLICIVNPFDIFI